MGLSRMKNRREMAFFLSVCVYTNVTDFGATAVGLNKGANSTYYRYEMHGNINNLCPTKTTFVEGGLKTID